MDRFVLFDRCAAQEGHRSSPRGADSLALSYRSIRFVGSSLTAPRVPHCCPSCLRCLGQQKTAMDAQARTIVYARTVHGIDEKLAAPQVQGPAMEAFRFVHALGRVYA